MNKYLIEILKIQNSVILPGLGALMVPSQKTGKIVFNQHLKFNDGSLARFIAEQEGIDNQEAQNKVAKFVREIEAELGKGNSYDMFEFGRFVKNNDGDVDFEMANEPVESDDSSAAKPKEVEKKKPVVTPADIIREESKEQKASEKEAKKAAKKEAKEKAASDKKDSIDEVKEKVEEVVESTTKKAEEIKEEVKEKVEEISKDKIVPPVIAQSKSADQAAEDKQAKNKFTPATEKTVEETKVAAVAAVEKGGEKIKQSIDQISDKVKDTKEAFDKKSDQKTEKRDRNKIVAKEEKEKKKKSKLPWIILLLLLIGLGVGGYFYKNQILAYFNKDADKTEMTENEDEGEEIDNTTQDESSNETLTDNISDDSLANETMTDEHSAGEDIVTEDASTNQPEDIVTEPVSQPAVSQSSSGSFHLIGNSFSEKSNAEAYVSSLTSKGYPAKILGRFDGLYMVSVKSYDSWSAAKNGISSVSADASEAWVFKWPK